MNRRELLLGCSTGLSILLGGCAGRSVDEESRSTPRPSPPEPSGLTESSSATPTATPAETPQPQSSPAGTATPTREPTPEPTPTPAVDGVTHAVGEQFTVGEDTSAVTYRITGLHRAAEIGDSADLASADGTYLVVVVELTNPQTTVTPFPWKHFRVWSADLNIWQRIDDRPSDLIDKDDRIDAASLAFGALPGGESVTGAVAFDVPTDGTFHVWVTPTDGSGRPEHFVPPRGRELSTVEQLEPR